MHFITLNFLYSKIYNITTRPCRVAEGEGEMRARCDHVKPLQKAGTYLKGKSSEKLAGAAVEPARTIDDSGLEPWMKMEAHPLVGGQFINVGGD